MHTLCAGILQGAYGLTVRRIEEVHGGLSARAFRTDTQEGTFFLKVYDTQKATSVPWIRRIDGYMPVLLWLSRQPTLRESVVRPVTTSAGHYKHEDGRYVYLLFAHIDGHAIGFGQPIALDQARSLAQTVAQLHDLGREIPCGTAGLEEDISLSFCDRLTGLLLGKDRIPEALSALIAPSRSLLLRAAERTVALRDGVRQHAERLSLCHTDLHGGNLMQADRLVLVDWEGLRLAPPEADLFMFAHEPCWSAFLEAYRAMRPGFRLNEDMLAFYLLRRLAEDIWCFIAELLYDHPSEDEARTIYGHLREQLRATETLMRTIDG